VLYPSCFQLTNDFNWMQKGCQEVSQRPNNLKSCIFNKLAAKSSGASAGKPVSGAGGHLRASLVPRWLLELFEDAVERDGVAGNGGGIRARSQLGKRPRARTLLEDSYLGRLECCPAKHCLDGIIEAGKCPGRPKA